MQLLGKMVFASDFERLLSRFCLWRFIWGLLFPADCRAEGVSGGLVLRVPGCSFPTLRLAAESSRAASEKAFG